MFLQVWCVPANRSRPGQHLRSLGQHPMHGQGQPRVTPPTLPRPIGGPISTTKCTSSRCEGVEIWMGLGSVASGWTQSSGRMQTCSRLRLPPHFASQNEAQLGNYEGCTNSCRSSLHYYKYWHWWHFLRVCVQSNIGSEIIWVVIMCFLNHFTFTKKTY